MPARRPTLHDVARVAGVSHMTVSRALRNVHNVAPPTLARVRQAVRETGYRPDPALSALAAYRHTAGRGTSPPYGVAFVDGDGSDFSRRVFEGVRREAELLGYPLERFAFAAEPAKQRRLGRMLFHRGTRGLLFGPSDAALRLEQHWEWPEFAAVSLGALAPSPELHAVAMDYFHGAFSACARLAAAGCRRVGLAIDARLEARTAHRWLGGYAAWAVENQRPALVCGRPMTQRRAVQRWWRAQKVDGLLTIHAELLPGVSADGIEVAFLNDSGAGLGVPFYSVKPETIGQEGTRLLHHLLLRREFGLPEQPQMLALRGSWFSPATGLHPRKS